MNRLAPLWHAVHECETRTTRQGRVTQFMCAASKFTRGSSAALEGIGLPTKVPFLHVGCPGTVPLASRAALARWSPDNRGHMALCRNRSSGQVRASRMSAMSKQGNRSPAPCVGLSSRPYSQFRSHFSQQCGLTRRSTGAPTAGHLARKAPAVYPAPRGQGVHPSPPG